MADGVRLTKRTIDALPAVERPKVFYDADVKGFGIRITPSGVKTFLVEYRPGGGGRGVAKRRMKLGAYGELTPDQARALAKDALADVRRGGDPAGARTAERAAPSLKELAEQWLAEEVQPKRKPRTTEGYGGALRTHVFPAIGTKKAQAVTSADVAKLHRKVGAASPFAANRTLAILSSMFSWAMRAHAIPKGINPCQGIRRFQEHRREVYLSTEQLVRLGEAIREAETDGIPWEPDPSKKVKHAPRTGRRVHLSPFTAAALRLLIFTGARLREILDLKWVHVDLERGMLLLPDSKTGRKTILLNAPAAAILAGLPRAGDYVIAGDDPKRPRADLKKPWALVSRHAGFTEIVEKLGEDGEPLKDRAGRPVMEERPTVRLHDLRHTHASVGAGAGLGLHMIGKLLGHTQAATTQRYAHLADDPLRAASETIGARLAAAMGEPQPQPTAEVVPLRKPASPRKRT